MLTDTTIDGNAAACSLRVQGLTRQYSLRNGWRKSISIQAACGVSFYIPAAKTLALVGSSGCGKSTVARCVTRLERPDSGEIWLGGVEISRLATRDLRPLRSHIQMIFQDPITSMNPRMSAREVIEEPLLIRERGSRTERRERAAILMEEVGVSPEWLDRRITEFSGGQCQRIAIARALVLAPRILVLDEALSGLDLSTQAQIVQLLKKLQATHSLTYLLISHDLGIVARTADLLAIMSGGRIIEQGPTAEIVGNPEQPETQALVAAAERLRAAFARARGASA